MKEGIINTLKSFTCVVIILGTGIALYTFSPDCRAIDTSQMVTTLNLDQRTDTTGIFPFRFKVFKKEQDVWYQCKTIIDRHLKN